MQLGLFVFLFACLFVRLLVSPLMTKLAASNFAQRFIGVQGRKSPIFVNFAPPEAQNRRNRRARGPRPPACKHYRRDTSRYRDAPSVKSRGVWTYDRHVWIYVCPGRRTYLLRYHEEKKQTHRQTEVKTQYPSTAVGVCCKQSTSSACADST